MIARHAAMRYARQRALVPFMPPASTTRCVAAPSPVSRAVSSGKAATATAAAPVGARAAHTEHRSLRGRSRGGCTARVSGCAADFPLEIGSKRALSSASLASDGEDVSVVEDGTESFLVAQRKLVVGHVLFGCTSGTLSAVGSRHSIQVTAGLHLTVSDDLQLMNHSCTPNCQLELVEASSTTGKGPCVRVVVIAPEIPEGRMLTVDYNAFEVDMTSSFDCACGDVNCRGHISGFSRLPPSVQQEYIQGRWSTSEVGAGGSGAPPLLTEVVKAWAVANVRHG